MVLFSLLGVIALLQRERKKVNNTHSGQEENADQSDVPPLRSCDDREVDDDWSEDLSREEPISSLLEVDNDRSKDITQEEPITSHSQVDDDWSDDFQDLLGDLSEWSADVLHALNSVYSNAIQTPVAPDCSDDDDVPQTTVCATSDSSEDVPQTTVCATSSCSDDVPQTTVCAKSSCSDDVPQTTVCAKSSCSDDVPQTTVCAKSSCSDDVPQTTVCAKSSCSDDVPQTTVCAKSSCSDDVPQTTVCAMSSCSDDVPQTTVCATSSCSDDVPQTTVCAKSSCSDDVPQTTVCAMSDSSNDVPQTTVCATSSCSEDVPQTTVCTTSSCSDDVPQTTVCAMSSCSDDVPQTTVCATSSCSDDVPQTTVCAKSSCSDDVPQTTVCATSSCSNDVPQTTVCAKSSCSDDVPQTTVCATSSCSDDVPQTTVCAKSSCTDDVPQTTVCAASSCSDGIPEAFLCATSDSSEDVLQASVSTMSSCSDDVPQTTVCATSSCSDDVPQTTVCAKSSCSDDIPQTTVCATSSCSDDVPQTTVCAKSSCSDDVPQTTVCATSSCSNDVPQTTVCAKSSCSDDVPQTTVCAKSSCTDDVPQTTVCAASSCSDGIPEAFLCATSDSSDDVLQATATVSTMSSCSGDVPSTCCDMSDCSVDAPQATVCQTEDTVPPQSSQLQDKSTIIDINSCRYEIGSQLGKGGFGTVYAATRLDDGLQVAIKFVSNRNKKFISIDDCSKPLPLEVALLILANEGPRVEEIIQILGWRVESDHYILVLERPMPCEELNWFLLRQIVTIEEDVAQVIMRQATFAAQTCCRRGVLHRDIKMENILINPDTLKVKLIDFGCGDFLTDAAYTSFAGTREYCPPEYHMTGQYHGEPATVWSLGVLLFALLCGDFPKIQDLEKINNNTWAKDGLSKECCDFIRRCLQIDPKQRIKLEKLSLHDWFMISDKGNNNGTIMDINSRLFEISSQLGKGAFGTVYAATRLEDGLQVAIKFVSNRNKKFISIDGCSKPLPLEVALLILANEGPRVEEIIQLLDWRVESDHYILVLERPMPCEELNWFLLRQIVTIEEDVAQVIMRQATFAAQTCCRRGVLHRDIKMENILINPDTLKVKLIDFGCGDFLTDAAYTSFAGTREYCPPEYLMTGQYHGEPATVWSLGVLLFALLCGDFPKIQDLEKINNNTWAKDGLSKECCDVICRCLQLDPKQRIELEKLSLHDWFTV